MIKMTVLTGLVAVLTGSAYAQGQLQLSNIENTSTNDPTATAHGLFWISTGGTPVLINQDFNAGIYAGTNSGSLTLLSMVLLSNGSANGDNVAGSGTFVDPVTGTFSFPNVSTVFVQIQAWTGNFNSYAEAVNGGAPAAQSPVFVNSLSFGPGPPETLTGMPAMVLGGSRAIVTCAGRAWPSDGSPKKATAPGY